MLSARCQGLSTGQLGFTATGIAGGGAFSQPFASAAGGGAGGSASCATLGVGSGGVEAGAGVSEIGWPWLSMTWKKMASSGMLPSFSHFLPVFEISSLRETLRSTIQRWSVVSSRKRTISPVMRRIIHSVAAAWMPVTVFAGAPFACTDGFKARKTWPHLLHFTGNPVSGTRASSSS